MVFSEEKLEYKVLGDIRYHREVIVWSVNRVMLQKKENNVIKHIAINPLLGLEHSKRNRDYNIYWQSFRRQEVCGDG
ncbi:type VI secretion system baseplate subunit TssF, partial [Escherichia coli]